MEWKKDKKQNNISHRSKIVVGASGLLMNVAQSLFRTKTENVSISSAKNMKRSWREFQRGENNQLT